MTRELQCWGVLAVASAMCASLSWRTWPDVIVDSGHQLYIPWRLSVGDVLYKDIAWATGPLSYYFNALVFWMFGASLSTLIAVNLLVLASIIAMLYYILRQCGTRGSATCACLFFITVTAFSQYSLIGNYNYLCPYRHDMTHGLALGLIHLVCVIKFGQSRKLKWLVASGFCLGLLSLTKVELTMASGLVSVSAFALFACQTRRSGNLGSDAESTERFSWRQRLLLMSNWFAITLLAAVVPMVIAVAAFAGQLGWSDSLHHVFRQYLLIFNSELTSGSGFYRAVLGNDHPIENLLTMTFTTIVVLAAIVAAYVIDAGLGRWNKSIFLVSLWGIAATLFGLFCIAEQDWFNLPACLPAFLPVIILLAGRNALQQPEGSATFLFLLAVYGLALLPKILLRVSWSHYGFVLAIPAVMVLIHVSLHSLPAWLSQYKQGGSFFRATMAGLWTACALIMLARWGRIDLSKSAAVGEQKDQFYADPLHDGRTIPTIKTLAYLQNAMEADDSLIVFPDGSILNFLLRKRNPSPFLIFNPWESAVYGGDARIAETVVRAAPDYAVIVTMDMEIHGRGNFGSPEFGGRIVEFLKENYEVVHREGSDWGIDGTFVATVFKRRSTTQGK